MKRRLFNVLAAVSLFACALVVVLWVRSYFIADIVESNWSRTSPLAASPLALGIRSTAGQLALEIEWATSKPDADLETRTWLHEPATRPSPGLSHGTHEKPGEDKYPSTTWMQRLLTSGWSFDDVDFGHGKVESSRCFWTGHGVVAAFLAVMPISLILSWWRRSRKGFVIGHCSACGYDLRASKDRCPECGAAIPAAAEPPQSSPRGKIPA